MILRNPQALWLLLLAPLIVALWRWRGRRVVPGALALRLGIVTLLVLAVADPLLGQRPPAPGPLVIVADQSDSLTDAGKEALRQRANQLAAQAGARARVLFFGADVIAPSAPDDVAAPDGSATDIAGALRAARALLGAGG
ncbi:MAG: VWA domain-containing protein, partial [Chloroflexales bacterium]|nr:VWA domain-containing protein [Chloroflexales bacterium]